MEHGIGRLVAGVAAEVVITLRFIMGRGGTNFSLFFMLRMAFGLCPTISRFKGGKEQMDFFAKGKPGNDLNSKDSALTWCIDVI